MVKRPEELQKRVDHARFVLERGLQMVKEGSLELRNQGVTVDNPLVDVPLLGLPLDPEQIRCTVNEVEGGDARRGIRRFQNDAYKSGRPRGRVAGR